MPYSESLKSLHCSLEDDGAQAFDNSLRLCLIKHELALLCTCKYICGEGDRLTSLNYSSKKVKAIG